MLRTYQDAKVALKRHWHMLPHVSLTCCYVLIRRLLYDCTDAASVRPRWRGSCVREECMPVFHMASMSQQQSSHSLAWEHVRDRMPCRNTSGLRVELEGGFHPVRQLAACLVLLPVDGTGLEGLAHNARIEVRQLALRRDQVPNQHLEEHDPVQPAHTVTSKLQ